MKKHEIAWTSLPVVKVIGRMMFDPVWSQRFHRASGLEFIHVLKSGISVTDGKCLVKAGEGDMVLIPSGIRHQDKFESHDDVEVFFCSMDWAHETLFIKPFGRPRRPLLIKRRNLEVNRMLEDLETDLTYHHAVDDVISGARLMTILMCIYRDELSTSQTLGLMEHNSPSRRKQLFEAAKDYISRHYAEHLSLDAIAASLKVSPYHLSRVFSSESSSTLFAFITCVRMQKARIMLADRRKNVAETACAVGFDDPHYFAKVFKNHYGCSPSEFVARQKKADLSEPQKPKRR